MRKIIGIVAALLAIAVLASLSSCGLFGSQAESKEAAESTGLVVSLLVPNYFGRSGSARAIAAQSAYVRLRLDDVEFTQEIALDSANSGSLDGREGAPLSVELRFGGVPARTYAKVSLDLLSAEGNVISTGSAFHVAVLPLEYKTVNFNCYVDSDSYEMLSPNAASNPRELAAGSMFFHKFYARTGGTYTISAAVTAGSPDLYLFLPNGKPAKIAALSGETTTYSYYSSYYASGSSVALDAFTVDGTDYLPGMYVVGVYAYGQDAANYSITEIQAGTLTASVAQENIDAGYACFRRGELDAALGEFGRAIVKDPTSGEAALGYTLMNLLSVLTDSRVTKLAVEKLGFADYPTTVSDVLSGSWLVDTAKVGDIAYSDSTGAPSSFAYTGYVPLPRIEGEEKFDGACGALFKDGIIDVQEKVVAFWYYYMTHNSGFDSFVDLLGGTLDDKFGEAVTAIASLSESDKFEVSWDLVFDNPEQCYDLLGFASIDSMPSFTIGTAELEVMASLFQVVRAFTNYGAVYSYDLSTYNSRDGKLLNLLQRYWDSNSYALNIDYSLSDSSFLLDPLYYIESPFQLPFFLKPTGDAGDHIDAASAAFASAFSGFSAAAAAIDARASDSGFFLNKDRLKALFCDDEDSEEVQEEEYQEQMAYFIKMPALLAASVENGDAFVLPTSSTSRRTYIDLLQAGTLPKAGDGEDWFALHLKNLFEQPLTALIELGASGEPAWYKWTVTGSGAAATAAISALTSVEQSSVVNDSTYSASNYLLKVSDLRLDGILDLDSFPVDDPATKYEVAELDWSDHTFSDVSDTRNANGLYDVGEYVTGIRIKADWDTSFLPIIDIANWAKYEYTDENDACSPINGFDLSSLTEADLRTWLGSAEGIASLAKLCADPTTDATDATGATGANGVPDAVEALLAAIDARIALYYDNVISSSSSGPIVFVDGNTTTSTTERPVYICVPASVVWNSVNSSSVYDSSGKYSIGSFWYYLLTMLGAEVK